MEEETFKDGNFDHNLQEQRDEILALQSIFNTNDEEKLKLLSEVNDEKDGLFTLLITVSPKPTSDLIHVDIALPTEEDSEAELAAAAACAENYSPPKLSSNIQLSRSESGRCWRGSFTMKYLCPLYLHAVFPPSYPSSEPPQFSISCGWLSSSQLTALSHQLDTLWRGGCLSPIVFTWVDWLENNSLSHLGITDHLVLRQSALKDEAKNVENLQNVIPWEEDIGEVIASMIRYNQQGLDVEFCQTTHECHVCYDVKPGVQFFRMRSCPHHFCYNCMAEFCEMHVRDGTVEALRCPDTECSSVIPPYIVQAVMGPEAYSRWEQLLLQKTLDAMSDTVYCPRCNSLVISEEEEELHLACCTVCFFAFCTQCEHGWHQGRACTTDEEILQQVQQTNQDGLTPAEARRLHELRLKLEQEIESKKTMKQSIHNCPACRIRVEKDGGCNKMTCKCGISFCWVCAKKIDGYAHFQKGGCILFPGETTAPVVAGIRRPPEAVLRIQARLDVNPHLANNRCHCPMCKQMNLKGVDNNNHIKCWNCKANFCFMCKQRIVGNINTHFMGPCMQHS